MSRFVSRYLLLFVFVFLLLALAACVSVTSTATPTPTATATPPEPMAEAWGAAVSAPAAAAGDPVLSLFPLNSEPWAHENFDLFDGAVQGDTEGRVLLALEESEAISGTYVLYTSLPIADAEAWYEYSWFASENGDEGPQIALGPGLPISRTVSFTPDESDAILADSYAHLDDVGWNQSRVRRMILQIVPGEYRLAIIECLPGQECDGSPASTDPFRGWCNRCSRRWCSGCRRFF